MGGKLYKRGFMSVNVVAPNEFSHKAAWRAARESEFLTHLPTSPEKFFRCLRKELEKVFVSLDMTDEEMFRHFAKMCHEMYDLRIFCHNLRQNAFIEFSHKLFALYQDAEEKSADVLVVRVQEVTVEFDFIKGVNLNNFLFEEGYKTLRGQTVWSATNKMEAVSWQYVISLWKSFLPSNLKDTEEMFPDVPWWRKRFQKYIKRGEICGDFIPRKNLVDCSYEFVLATGLTAANEFMQDEIEFGKLREVDVNDVLSLAVESVTTKM